MLKDQTTQPTLFQEDSHANHSQLQENEEDKTMIVTSGMKLLELLPKQNQNGLLAKMLKGLLTSTTAWYSDRCKLIWKKKVSKSNVLLYQLQASVLGIKEKEFGLLPTPTQDSASERTKKYKQGGTPLTVAVKMFPTPTVGCEEGGEQSKRVEQTKSGGFILRKKNKPNSTFGAKLSDAMLYLEKMYPTPSSRDWKGGSGTIVEKNGKYYRQSNTTGQKWGVCLDALMEKKNNKPGGKLNPNFVEFLMGYAQNWTRIE